MIKGTTFEIRDYELKLEKNRSHILKIEGKIHGLVNFKHQSILPIVSNSEKVGDLLIQFEKE